MAIDSLLKRFTIMQLGGETSGMPPMVRFTSGALGPAARAMALWLYNGVALDEPGEPEPAGGVGPSRLSLTLGLGL